MKIVFNQADVTDWLALARDDMLFARSVRDSGYWRHVCFTAQQAAEKGLKAIMYSLQDDFSLSEIKEMKTHNLHKIFAIIQKRGVNIPDAIVETSESLDKYYLSSRYPDVPDPIGTYSQDMAHDALDKAEQVISFVYKYFDIDLDL